MATFQHGKDAEVFWNGYDLTSYLKTAGVERSCDTAETTTFGNDDKTYVAGLGDATFSAEGLSDQTSPGSDEILNTALGVESAEVSYYPEGDTIGNFGHALQGQETAYSVTSPVSDVVSVSCSAQSSVGSERVVSLKALGQVTASGTATAVDSGAASSGGFAAYLHNTGVVSGTVAVKIQDSADDSTYADLTGGAFTDLTAGTTSERISGTANPRQYVRLVHTNAAGTATFQVGLSRNPTTNH